MADALESETHFLAAGHWASETFGIRRLGELVAEEFDVEHEFVAIPNPVLMACRSVEIRLLPTGQPIPSVSTSSRSDEEE